ncbi:Uncharacterised protein [Bordetella avium]|nr:Uncharacterised protein [Bordetella avium]
MNRSSVDRIGLSLMLAGGLLPWAWMVPQISPVWGGNCGREWPISFSWRLRWPG